MNVIYRIMLAAISALHLQAAIFEFTLDLQSSSTTARGRSLYEVDPGSYPPITLDTGNHTLRLPVGWGSVQIPGNTDLSSAFLTAEIVMADPGQPSSNPYTAADGTGALPIVSQKSAGISGYFDNTLALIFQPGLGYPVAQQENDLLQGKWQLWIRSDQHQEGELRGFIVPVPEPTLTGFIMAFLLLASIGYCRLRGNRLSCR